MALPVSSLIAEFLHWINSVMDLNVIHQIADHYFQCVRCLMLDIMTTLVNGLIKHTDYKKTFRSLLD